MVVEKLSAIVNKSKDIQVKDKYKDVCKEDFTKLFIYDIYDKKCSWCTKLYTYPKYYKDLKKATEQLDGSGKLACTSSPKS